MVRDHRGPQADAGPREAPPPIREERVRPKGRGWVWVSGYWDWKGGRWQWTGGRWEKARQGQRWRPLAWELRNGVYVRVDGSWIEDRPNQAPPPPRQERFDNRRGFVWVPGHWDWENGQYVWVDGKYEREQRGKRWRPAKWELRGGAWVRVDGGWDDDYPMQAPPPPRTENPGTRGGFVWIPGNYEWRNGQYEWVNGRWERERSREQWVDGRWELKNGRWEWTAGRWGACPEYPPLDTAPPAPQNEPAPPPGYIRIAGHWQWQNCRYVWSAGSNAKARPGYRYQQGSWLREPDKNRWRWTNGDWVSDAPSTPPPPAYPNTPPPPPSGPTQPPPPPRAENPGTKGGFVWIRGHYEWRGNQYEWIPGHWERERARQSWIDGRWELRAGAYVWVPGNWQ